MTTKEIALYAALLLSACATAPEVKTWEENVSLVERTTHSEIDVAEVFIQAQKAYNAEDYQRSQDLFGRIIIRNDKNIAAAIGYGNAALASGEFELALAHFQALVDRDLQSEDMTQVQGGLALADIWSGVSDQPLERINEALESNAEDPRLWSAKGKLLDESEEWLAAQDAYVEALKTGKAHSGTVNNMGMSLLRQGRYDEAQAKFEQALELKPETRLYDNNRRMTLFLKNDIIAGLEEFPDDRASTLLNDAGFIALQQGELALAEFLFEKAIDISPTYHVQAVRNLEQVEAQKAELAG